MWYYLCKICHKNGENAPCGGNEGKTDMKYASNNIRNILIAGHAGSGKTTLTEALVDMFTRRTRLMQVDEGGDFAFEGEIVNYTSTTASVSSDDYALLNRLTITVKVRFTNALDEKMSFNRTFQAYEDYDSTKLLTEVEGELIPQIVDKIVTDIFQAAASNW